MPFFVISLELLRAKLRALGQVVQTANTVDFLKLVERVLALVLEYIELRNYFSLLTYGNLNGFTFPQPFINCYCQMNFEMIQYF